MMSVLEAATMFAGALSPFVGRPMTEDLVREMRFKFDRVMVQVLDQTHLEDIERRHVRAAVLASFSIDASGLVSFDTELVRRLLDARYLIDGVSNG